MEKQPFEDTSPIKSPIKRIQQMGWWGGWSLTGAYMLKKAVFGRMYYRVSIAIFVTVDGTNPTPANYNSFPRLEVVMII